MPYIEHLGMFFLKHDLHTNQPREKLSALKQDFDAGLILQQERLQLVWESQSNRNRLFVCCDCCDCGEFFFFRLRWGGVGKTESNKQVARET